MCNGGEEREKKERKDKKREEMGERLRWGRRGERRKTVDIIWIGLTKNGHYNSTLELCGKAIYLLCMTPGRNMEESGFGEIFRI